MKIIIYTCNINNYDRRRPVLDLDENTMYLYYSDDTNRIEGWKVMPVNKKINEDPIKVARYYKINSHLLPPHEYSIWIDSSFALKHIKVLKYVKENLGKNDMACYYHGRDNEYRNCLYKEAAVCLYNKKGKEDAILDQIVKYRTDGYPIYNGLLSTGVIIRKNNSKIKQFNELWWQEVEKYSSRDQVSQMYAIWKSGISYSKIVNQEVYNNDLVKYHYHNHRQEDMKNKTAMKSVKKKHNILRVKSNGL